MPKNAMGLHRSKEFMKANPAAAPKLHHLRVTPMEHGGANVTHHASPSGPAYATHVFDEKQGEEMANHVMEHGGKLMDSEGGGDHYADEGEETEA